MFYTQTWRYLNGFLAQTQIFQTWFSLYEVTGVLATLNWRLYVPSCECVDERQPQFLCMMLTWFTFYCLYRLWIRPCLACSKAELTETVNFIDIREDLMDGALGQLRPLAVHVNKRKRGYPAVRLHYPSTRLCVTNYSWYYRCTNPTWNWQSLQEINK